MLSCRPQRGRGSAGRASPCQGEGRGFESRRPLQVSDRFPVPLSRRFAHHAHRFAHHGDRGVDDGVCRDPFVNALPARSNYASSTASTRRRNAAAIDRQRCEAAVRSPNANSQRWSPPSKRRGRWVCVPRSANCSKRGSRLPRPVGRRPRFAKPGRCSTATCTLTSETSRSVTSTQRYSTPPTPRCVTAAGWAADRCRPAP